MHFVHTFYILVCKSTCFGSMAHFSIIFRILRGTNMKPFIFSACNMRIHYGYITIRRKFREKKIDSVVRWIFWWITFYNVAEKAKRTTKSRQLVNIRVEWKIKIWRWRSTWLHSQPFKNFIHNKSFVFWLLHFWYEYELTFQDKSIMVLQGLSRVKSSTP